MPCGDADGAKEEPRESVEWPPHTVTPYPMSRTMSSRRAILSFLVIALGLPAPAAAQIDPGINFDPGSPAGKEYAIPLAEGRSEAAGTSDPRTGANIPFGVGIEPPGGGSGGDGGAGTGGPESGSRGEPGGAAGAGGRVEDERGAASGSTSLAEAESEPGTAWQTLVMALAVLLPAALLAVVLAARRPSRTGRTA